jgi:(p)ppGpp synthase/HD superfamily hydrolase
MAPRIEVVQAEAADFLHPGRTALILMLDTEEGDPLTLAAAMLVDSERPELEAWDSLTARPVSGTAEPLADFFSSYLQDAAELAASVPVRGSDLLERLVTSDERVQRIALAERLDQLRHAHLWTDPARRRHAHDEATSLYAPLAARVHERLSQRFDRWCEMFEKRHLGGGS